MWSVKIDDLDPSEWSERSGGSERGARPVPSSSLRFRFRDLFFVWATRLLCLQAVGLVARFDDLAVVCRPIQQRRGHLGVAEHIRLFRESEVGGDDHTGVFVQF
jgi:hypothetical protein